MWPTHAREESAADRVDRRIGEAVSDCHDQVDHPPHYGGKDDPYEAIKVIDAWGLGFCLGNTVKYINRAGKKGSALEDLKKARWYLDHAIERLEELEAVEHGG